MSRKQAKRAAFACRQRAQRRIMRVMRQNRGQPGFFGVVSSLKVDGVARLGMGALFIRREGGAV